MKLKDSPSPGKSSKTSNDEPQPKRQGTPSSESQMLEWIDENFDVVIYPTGFEDCIVGIGERYGGPPVAVLDVAKMLAHLEKEGMTYDEALEYFEFNILAGYVGEQTPVYMHLPDFKTNKSTQTNRKRKATA